MKATALKGLPLRSAAARGAQETVADLILDLRERRVLALQVAQAGSDVGYVVRAEDVARVDRQGVEVQAGAAPLPLDDQPQYETKPTFDKIIHQDVIGEDGTARGVLADLDVDTERWRIEAYDVAPSITEAFEQGLQRIPAESARAGEKTIVVMGQAVQGR